MQVTGSGVPPQDPGEPSASYWCGAIGATPRQVDALRDAFEQGRGLRLLSSPPNSGRQVKPLHRRMSLGFDKATTALRLLMPVPADALLSPFGGGGGLAKLALLLPFGRITLGDIRYPGSGVDRVSDVIDVRGSIEEWCARPAVVEVASPNCGAVETVRWDARLHNREWRSAFDCIVADPPFGLESKALGHSDEDGRSVLDGLLRTVASYLRENGRVVVACPSAWTLMIDQLANASGLVMRKHQQVGRRTSCVLLVLDK